jgi:hypothetical protein
MVEEALESETVFAAKPDRFYNALQVMELHSTSTRLHIGCDEVWCLGQAPATAAHMEARGLSLVDLFIRHVAAVARYAKELQPNVQVKKNMQTADADPQQLVENNVFYYLGPDLG